MAPAAIVNTRTGSGGVAIWNSAPTQSTVSKTDTTTTIEVKMVQNAYLRRWHCPGVRPGPTLGGRRPSGRRDGRQTRGPPSRARCRRLHCDSDRRASASCRWSRSRQRSSGSPVNVPVLSTHRKLIATRVSTAAARRSKTLCLGQPPSANGHENRQHHRKFLGHHGDRQRDTGQKAGNPVIAQKAVSGDHRKADDQADDPEARDEPRRRAL